MAPIPPPEAVVIDGKTGSEEATWPDTRVQRCVFHAFNQVKKQTTARPNLQVGVELYGIAKALLRVKTTKDSAEWLLAFNG